MYLAVEAIAYLKELHPSRRGVVLYCDSTVKTRLLLTLERYTPQGGVHLYAIEVAQD